MIFRRFMILIAFFGFLVLMALSVTAQEADTLVVNYYRYDEDYSFFDSVWLWPHEPEADEGERYFFEEETDFGMQLELDLAETNLAASTKVGIIVRGDNWDRRDVGIDLFIDMTEPDADGTIEVYLVQADPTVYYDEEDADRSHRILHTFFEDYRNIRFRTTQEIGPDAVEVLADGEPVAIEDAETEGFEGTVRLTDDADLAKSYELRADVSEEEPAVSRIGFDGIYDSDAFNEQYAYDGELGAIHGEEATEFKLWAPIAESVVLNLYEKGHPSHVEDLQGNAGVDEPYAEHDMEAQERGVWSKTVEGDLDGVYYTFSVDNGDGYREVTDPYSYSTGANGERSMVVDFDRHNPEGWEYGRSPGTIENYTDAILYELHVRDLTSHESWDGPEEYRGKFLGLVEEGTRHEGVKTGLAHIKELGVTHVHLLPVMHFGMVDETRLDDPDYHGIYDGIFNWGYMPIHYNTLEGSYATDPFNGEVRVTEFKKMVQGFHDNDIGVVMDVVYNHTGQSADSNFHQILPGYYHRFDDDGNFSNGSGTGNETASERAMFRKFMLDSLTFYVEEYNIDGFRFDLMALHDIETMNMIAEALHEIDEDVIIYGEPWMGGETVLPQHKWADKTALDELDDIAVFNDNSRDAVVQGSAFDNYGRGFVSGIDGRDDEALLGVTGGIDIPGLNVRALPEGAWAFHPSQTVNYVSAHDNNTVRDKLVLATIVYNLPAAEREDITREDVEAILADGAMETIEKMQRQANTFVLTSQGIPFLHAGVEMMRTKPCIDPDFQGDYCDDDGLYDANSYRSPDETNQLDWNWKVEHYDTFRHHRNLIHMRREVDVFTLATAEEVRDHLRIRSTENGLIAYALENPGEDWQTVLVVHNNASATRDFEMPGGEWRVVATTDEIGNISEEKTLTTLRTIDGGTILSLDANDSYIMYSEDLINVFADPADYEDPIPVGIVIGIVIGAFIVIGGAVATAYLFRKRA